ncbi:hypothetical protein CR513_23542, partial [Mucuna pruriens]
MDEVSNQMGSGVGIILEGLERVMIEQSLRFEFRASNNQAKYEALLAGVKLAKKLGGGSEWRIPDQESPIDEILGHSTGIGHTFR